MIAEHLDVSEKDVIEMQKRLQAPDMSLDAPLKNEDSSAGFRSDVMPDEKIEDTEELLALQQRNALFAKYLAEFKELLSGRDLEVFQSRLLTEDIKTLQQIGDEYNISRERARQIEARIIQKLKNFVKAKGTLE